MFYSRLKLLMLTNGVTKKKLSDDLKIGKNVILYWEKNCNIPSGRILCSIANYFDVSTDFLISSVPIWEIDCYEDYFNTNEPEFKTKMLKDWGIPDFDGYEESLEKDIARGYKIPFSELIKKPSVDKDKDLDEYLDYLRTRPEMKMLFSVSKKATKEEIEKIVKIVEAMLGD